MTKSLYPKVRIVHDPIGRQYRLEIREWFRWSIFQIINYADNPGTSPFRDFTQEQALEHATKRATSLRSMTIVWEG